MAVPYELIPITFLLLMIYLTYISYRRNQIQKYGLYFWTCFWIIGIFLVIFHTYFNPFLSIVNVTRVFDLYTMLGFIALLFIAFYLFRAMNRIERKLENLTRTIALKDNIENNKNTENSNINNSKNSNISNIKNINNNKIKFKKENLS